MKDNERMAEYASSHGRPNETIQIGDLLISHTGLFRLTFAVLDLKRSYEMCIRIDKYGPVLDFLWNHGEFITTVMSTGLTFVEALEALVDLYDVEPNVDDAADYGMACRALYIAKFES